MRIRTTLWLGMLALTVGYVTTVTAHDIASRRSDAFLDRLVQSLVPANHAAQTAVMAFTRMMTDYEDAVVAGDVQAIGRATEEGRSVAGALRELNELPDLPTPFPGMVANLGHEFADFSTAADATYRRASANGAEAVSTMRELSRRAQILARSLLTLEKSLQGELRHTITGQRERMATERLVSDGTMIALLVGSIVIVTLLTARWTHKLQGLITASQRMAKGDYDSEVVMGGSDEIGQLGEHIESMRRAIGERDLSLRVFNDTLEHQISDRTKELQQRNQDLSNAMAERNRVEANLRAAHEEAETMLASLGAALIGLDSDDLVTRWNQTAERLFGITAADVIGRSLAETGIRCDWAEVFLAIERCNREQQPVEIAALRYENPRQESRWMAMLISPSRSHDGSRPGRGRIVLLATDITQRRIDESQAGQHAKLETIGQLASGIAHEINTPIQFIGDNLRFLAEQQGAERALLAGIHDAIAQGRTGQDLVAAITELEERHDIGYLHDQAPRAIAQSLEGTARVAEIILAMKAFAHPDQGSITQLDLNAAVRTTIEVCRNEYKYVADIVLRLDPELPTIPCQAGQIHQVILNLIVNAAHAIAEVVANTDERGTITITTTHDDHVVTCAIADTGIGIPSAIRPKIFTPFFTTKAVGKGTGQGLHLAYNIVEKQHHGRIRFNSREGAGTTFTITLPRAQHGVPTAV